MLTPISKYLSKTVKFSQNGGISNPESFRTTLTQMLPVMETPCLLVLIKPHALSSAYQKNST